VYDTQVGHEPQSGTIAGMQIVVTARRAAASERQVEPANEMENAAGKAAQAAHVYEQVRNNGVTDI
jgi:hypothetical protein